MLPKNHIYRYPQYYEIGFKPKAIRKELSFIINIYRKYRRKYPLSSLLDNACGTGFYLKELAKLNIKLSGYDKSSAMVKYASLRLRQASKKSSIFKADLRNFSVKDKYDMAIAMNGSFQYLLTVKDVLLHLSSVSNALKLGGVYLISLPSPQEFLDNPPGLITSKWNNSFGKISVQVNWTYKQKQIDWTSQTFSGLAKIQVKDNRRVLNLSMPYKYRIFFPKEIECIIKMSRYFEILDIYGDFNCDNYFSLGNNAKCMNVVLKKKRR